MNGDRDPVAPSFVVTAPVSPSVGRRLPSAVLAALALATWAFIGFYLFHWGATWALDLRVYRAAASSLWHHGSPYTTAYTSNDLLFTYPPFALLVLSPLSFGSLALAKALWWLVNGVALVVVLFVGITTAGPSVAKRRALLFAAAGGAVATIALEPLRSNLDYGQVNLVLMALVVLDLLVVRGRGRGVLVGVAAALKLTPLVYLAYFLVQGDRRSALRGAGTFVGLGVLSWAVLPSQSARYWLHDAFSPGRTGPVGSVSNQSWNGLVHRPPFHAGPAGVALWALLSAVTVAVGVVAARRRMQAGRRVDAVLALALVELLVSPISWSHHWSWLVLAPIVAWSAWADRPVRLACLVGLGIAFAEPYWWPVGGWLGAIFADSLTLAGAALLAALARHPSNSSAGAGAFAGWARRHPVPETTEGKA